MEVYKHIRYAQGEKRQRHSEMTMKKNIKLDIENWTDIMTDLHSLPTRMCFNFFTHRTKILKFCLPTLHTFASPTMPTLKPKLAKECNFACPQMIGIVLTKNEYLYGSNK